MSNPFEIVFEKKFTQKDIDSFVNHYFNNTIVSTQSQIVFNLEQLEWISSEEITFLYAWIRKLHLDNKNVIVKMPVVSKKFEDDDEEAIARRKFLNSYLYIDWKLYSTGIKDNIKNLLSDTNNRIEKRSHSDTPNKILPFQIINTEYNPKKTIDNQFYTNTNGKFTIDNDIVQLLNDNNCYSPFENKVISDIITKELFMNSAEHAQTNESYFAIALRDKWKNPFSIHFKNQFLLEKEKATLNFYRDKEKILPVVKEEALKVLPNRITRKKVADLTKKQEYNIFKNQSSLEFTFIDFGKGIHETLKDEYEKNKKKSYHSLSNNIYNKHIHSQILEYAFLLDSSKDPFDNRIEKADLIPRGLYFLIDMVRRYKGLLVARSGYGKVIYDFSDRIYIENKNDTLLVSKDRVYTVREAVIPSEDGISYFKGTFISIVLPERKSGEFRKAGVRIDNYKLNKYIFNKDNSNDYPRELFAPKTYEYLDLSFLYNAYHHKIEGKRNLLHSVYYYISEKLTDLNERDENCVLFVDFKNLPQSNQIFKIISYLQNTALVSEKVKVIAGNIRNDDLNALKEYFHKHEYISETSFLFKAIPSLNINKSSEQTIGVDDIQWIGVDDKDDDYFFTQMLLNPENSVDLSNIKAKHLSEGNVITTYQGRALSIFGDFNNLVSKIKEGIANFSDFNNLIIKTEKDGIEKGLLKWISDKENEFPVMQDGKDNKILYLTAKGTYQEKYLSFYESLSFKYTARFFAQLLLHKYIEVSIADFEKRTGIEFSKLKEDEKLIVNKTFNFDKIIAVTVSSQLLAIELKYLIKENNLYKFLGQDKFSKTQNIKQICDRVSFVNTKEKFNNIINDSKDLVGEYYDYYIEWIKTDDDLDVCPDLIKLSSYYSFEEEKPFKEIKSNHKIIIVNDVISTGSLIKRLLDGIKQRDSIVKGILSIADTRRELKDIDEDVEYRCEYFTNEEEDKVISIISSKRNTDFIIKKLKTKPVESQQFKVKRINPILNSIVTLNSKHTEQNKILFKNPKDFIDFKAVKNDIFQIGHFKQSLLSHSSYYTDMNSLLHNTEGMNLLKKCKEEIDIRIREKCNPFFIFYPVHSGIEQISEDTYHEVFKTDRANIIGLQRYQTPLGWRFVFPPKRFNEIIKGQQVLIVDSGTLSGQSLVQLIDAVSIYEVSRIDALIIIGRLDDFQREFYSRLQTIKVKTKVNNKEDETREVIVPINIFFGTNLHIPSYQTEEMCPFCRETTLLKEYVNKYSEQLPVEAKSYIEKRIGTIISVDSDNNTQNGEIKLQESGQKYTPKYIPIDRKTKQPDFRGIFLMRDELGKVDGYRFYEDYFSRNTENEEERLDDLCNRYANEQWNDFEQIDKKDLRKFELILICILHEQNLVPTIRDLLINLFDILQNIVNKLIHNDKLRKELIYNWSKYAILRIYYSFVGEKKFYTPANFEVIYNFCQDDKDSWDYLSFLLAREGLKLKLEKDRHHYHISEILARLNKIIPHPKSYYARGVVDKLRKNPNIIENVTTIKEAFETLYKFFVKLDSTRMHGDFSQKFSQVDMVKDNPIETKERYNLYISAIKFIMKELRNNMFNCLKIIHDDASLQQCFDAAEYDMLFHNKENEFCVFNFLKNIIEFYNCNDFDEMTEKSQQKIKELSSLLYEFKISHILNSNINSFPSYCKDYMSDVDILIDEVPATNKKLQVTYNKNDLKSRMIPLHKSFYKKMIKEIFDNAVNHANKQDKNIILDIKVEPNIDGCCYNLIFKQSTEFDDSTGRQGGTKDIIEKLLQIFFPNKHKITHSPNYIIEINVIND